MTDKKDKTYLDRLKESTSEKEYERLMVGDWKPTIIGNMNSSGILIIRDYHEANSYLDANIRFRDWKIEVRNHGGSMGHCLYVRVRVKDNFGDNMIDLVHTRPLLPFPMDEVIFVNCVWEQMLAILRHEAGEQFYVKGKLPYNEHDTDMNLHKAILDD